MQDKAPIHASYLVKNWFSDNAILVLKWPPYSPDLNLIEHALARLKETVHALNPGLEEYGGGEDILKEYPARLIVQAWSEISQDYFNRLVAQCRGELKL
jgi:transposase